VIAKPAPSQDDQDESQWERYAAVQIFAALAQNPNIATSIEDFHGRQFYFMVATVSMAKNLIQHVKDRGCK